jgi:hypothetical protein
MWTQKIHKLVSKYKLKHKESSNEELINEAHWNFLIYIYIYRILIDMIVLNFTLGSPFHIKFFSLLHGFFNYSHV